MDVLYAMDVSKKDENKIKRLNFFLFTHCLNKGNNTAISDFQVWKKETK
jgi:hypothetical protein